MWAADTWEGMEGGSATFLVLADGLGVSMDVAGIEVAVDLAAVEITIDAAEIAVEIDTSPIEV